MALDVWKKDELKEKGDEGYKVIVCKDENEAMSVRDRLKAEKKCARAGMVRNQDGNMVIFVLTKERVKRNG